MRQGPQAEQLTNADYYYIWTLMRNIAHMTGRIRDEELSRYGVTLMQASVLYMVKALGDDATPRNLSRWLFREPPTISDGLARMEKQGLIKKVPMNYRGQIRIVLTEAGERAYQNSTLRTSILNIMARVPSAKLLQLKSLLQEIRGSVMTYMGLAPQSSHLPETLEAEYLLGDIASRRPLVASPVRKRLRSPDGSSSGREPVRRKRLPAGATHRDGKDAG